MNSNPIHHLELHFLGAPQIAIDGIHIELETRKATALIAFLAISGGSHSRDELAVLLYPDYDETHARGALRRTLSALNKAIGESYLRGSRERIEFIMTPFVQIDVYQFKGLIEETKSHTHSPAHSGTHLSPLNCKGCAEKLEQAVNLYQGDFLSGFTLRDSPNFDDWQFFRREELRRDLTFALKYLSIENAYRGNHDKALHFAHRWLSLDLLSEEAHRQLMSCYYFSGQRNAALRQFQECVRILEKELGVPPLEETIELYNSILGNRLKRPQSVLAFQVEESVSPSNVPDQLVSQNSRKSFRKGALHLPLVGRSKESEILVQAFKLNAPNGYFLALLGETGIGKTRLAEEFLSYAETQGSAIIRSRCYEGEANLAFSPIIDGLNTILSEGFAHELLERIPAQFLTELSRLVPAISQQRPELPAPQPLSNLGAQSLFYEGLRQSIHQLCAGNSPGILFIDDLQWVDSATLDFLAYMIRRLPGQPFLVLGVWTQQGLTEKSNLFSLLAEMQRSGYASTLELSRLQPNDIREIIRITSDQHDGLPAGLESRLYQETEGLPFILLEYLGALLERGNEGLSEQLPDRDWALPDNVRDMLRKRLLSLDELTRQILTTAAVIGRSFDFLTLALASGRTEIETLNGLETLLERGFVEECSSFESTSQLHYDFTHEKLRNQVYEEISYPRRRLLHQRVAEALLQQRRSHREDGLLDSKIGYHFAQASQDQKAAEHFKIAAEHARSLYANQEAIAHLKSALAVNHPARQEILEMLGDLYTLQGDYSEALQSYELAIEQKQDPVNHARLLHKIGLVHLRTGNWELAALGFQEALPLLDAELDHRPRAHILADYSLTVYRQNQLEKAIILAQEALHLASEVDDRRALAQSHNLLGILARSQTHFESALRHLTISLQISQEMHDESARAAALNNLALVLHDTGEITQAIEFSLQALEIYQRIGDRHRTAAVHSNLADQFHESGQVEQAMTHLKASVVILTEIGEKASERRPEIWKLTEW